MALLGALFLSGCAGPMPTFFAGETPDASGERPVDFTPASDLHLPDGQWQVVKRAMEAAGMAEVDESSILLSATITERPARIGMQGTGETVLAPAKRPRALQSCKDRTYRLVISLSDRRSGAVVRRGWAEESHCRGGLPDALPRLAGHAVQMLVNPVRDGQQLYWRTD